RLRQEDLARHGGGRRLRALRRHRRDRRGDRGRRVLLPGRAGETHRCDGRAGAVLAGARGPHRAVGEERVRGGQGVVRQEGLRASAMPATVIMPALELAQETGKVLKWLKNPGDSVRKGEPIVEIETDKVTVEVEAPASGVLREVSAQPGDVVPVGKAIALIFAAGEVPVAPAPAAPAAAASAPGPVKASPLARKVAEQHGVDIAAVKTASGRVEKADVLAYV